VALVAASTAIPDAEYFENRVPETDLIDISYDPAHEAQVAVTALIQQGKDEGACADLAASTIKEVEDAVDSQQKILNGLDTGNDCDKAGQDMVDIAQKAVSDAQQAVTDAEKALSDAQAAPVQFADMALDTLEEGKCEVFFADAAFTAAKVAETSAQEELEQAKGAKTAADNALTAAKEAQKGAQNECYCRTKAAFEKAWEAANANNDANAKAYTKGKHMECVLKGTTPADCQIGEIPAPKKPNLHVGVASCSSAAPTPAPTPYAYKAVGAIYKKETNCQVGHGKNLEYLDRQKVKCSADQAIEQFWFLQGGCGDYKMRFKFKCRIFNHGFSNTFTKKTKCEAARGKDIRYLDRQNVDCGDGNVLTGFHLNGSGCSGNEMRFKYWCATPVAEMGKTETQYTKCSKAKNKHLEWLDRHDVKCFGDSYSKLHEGLPMQGFKFTGQGCSGDENGWYHMSTICNLAGHRSL
jgi:hypothetical protein